MELLNAEVARNKLPQTTTMQEYSGGYTAAEAAWWTSRPGATSYVYMKGAQAGKRREVAITKIYVGGNGAVMLEVHGGSPGQVHRYRLDEVRDAKAVRPNADEDVPHDRQPLICFEEGDGWPMLSENT